MSIRQIHQILPTVAYGDAIGNHVLQLRALFREWGYDSEVFAQHWHPSFSPKVRPYGEYAHYSHPDNILIWHYSIGGEVNGFVPKLPDRLLLYYHNITPAHFFYPYNGELALLVEDGRRDLARLAGAVPAIAGSGYNGQELDALGFEVLGVVPYAFAVQQLDAEARSLAAARLARRFARPGSADWLHVGRLSPNKCLQDVLKAFYYYHTWINPESRLLFVGTGDGLQHYLDRLYRLVTALRLDGAVVFTGQVETPAPFYPMASLYVTMSEHEGFCIPLLEAMHYDVPVLAYASTAVPETLGGSGILVRRKVYPVIAEIAHEMIDNGALRERLVARQRERLAAFSTERVQAELRACLDRLAGR